MARRACRCPATPRDADNVAIAVMASSLFCGSPTGFSAGHVLTISAPRGAWICRTYPRYWQGQDQADVTAEAERSFAIFVLAVREAVYSAASKRREMLRSLSSYPGERAPTRSKVDFGEREAEASKNRATVQQALAARSGAGDDRDHQLRGQ